MKTPADRKLQTPQEILAILTAQASAHNADRLDPLARERREAERLAAIVREEYSTPGGGWQYIGEVAPAQMNPAIHCHVGGIGYFLRPVRPGRPSDIRALGNVFTCLRACGEAQTVEDALLESKRLIPLLRAAQAAIGAEHEPCIMRDSKFSDLRRDIVRALYDLGATGRSSCAGARKIKDRMGEMDLEVPDEDRTFQRGLVWLRDKGLIERRGEESRTAVYRLTMEGAEVAEYLDL